MTAGVLDLRSLAARTITGAGRARCAVVRAFAFDVESSDRAWVAPLRGHIDGCLTCQAELVRARQTLRELRGMVGGVSSAPPGLTDIRFDEIEADEASGIFWADLSPTARASVSAVAMGVALYIGKRLLASDG